MVPRRSVVLAALAAVALTSTVLAVRLLKASPSGGCSERLQAAAAMQRSVDDVVSRRVQCAGSPEVQRLRPEQGPAGRQQEPYRVGERSFYADWIEKDFELWKDTGVTEEVRAARTPRAGARTSHPPAL
jgi:hypothetical protein